MGELRRAFGYQHLWGPSAVLPCKIEGRTDRGGTGTSSAGALCQAALPVLQGAVEPMQIDVDPQEDPQNAPDVNYVVENPTLVWIPCGGGLLATWIY